MRSISSSFSYHKELKIWINTIVRNWYVNSNACGRKLISRLRQVALIHFKPNIERATSSNSLGLMMYASLLSWTCTICTGESVDTIVSTVDGSFPSLSAFCLLFNIQFGSCRSIFMHCKTNFSLCLNLLRVWVSGGDWRCRRRHIFTFGNGVESRSSESQAVQVAQIFLVLTRQFPRFRRLWRCQIHVDRRPLIHHDFQVLNRLL